MYYKLLRHVPFSQINASNARLSKFLGDQVFEVVNPRYRVIDGEKVFAIHTIRIDGVMIHLNSNNFVFISPSEVKEYFIKVDDTSPEAALQRLAVVYKDATKKTLDTSSANVLSEQLIAYIQATADTHANNTAIRKSLNTLRETLHCSIAKIDLLQKKLD